jgi:ArsR family transcriptional regulator
VSKRRRPRSPAQASAVRRPIDRLLDPDLFKALCDPTRARLVACLAKCGRPCSVTEVAACCAVDFSVVSRHLSTLARAGIVEATKEGRVVRYEVRYARVCAALRGLADAIDECCPAGRPTEGGCGCG